MEASHHSTTMVHGTLRGMSTPTRTGFRFFPTEKEILVDYLLNKVTKQPLPSDAIKEIDLYGDEKIWQRLFEESGESFIYFFTKLKKKTERGFRIERVAGFGSWRAQKDTQIFHRKQHIGSKRAFSYIVKAKGKGKRGSSNKAEGRWTMTEYRLDGCLLKHVKDNEFVVCLIKKLKRKGEDDDGIHIIDSAVSTEHYFGDTYSVQKIRQAGVPEACDTSSQLLLIQTSSFEPQASTLIDFGSSFAGTNSAYIDCPPAFYSSSPQQEVQMAPITEPTDATSILEAEAQGQMMEYSGSKPVLRDDLESFVGFDSFSREEVQKTSIKPNGIPASMQVGFQSQGQMNQTGSNYVNEDVLGHLVSSSVEPSVSSYVTEASTLIECGSSVAGANLTYIDCPRAYNSSPQQEEAQMAPSTEPNDATSTLEGQAQGQIMGYSGSNPVFTDDLGYFVGLYSVSQEEVQMTSIEPNGFAASMEFGFQSQGQMNQTSSNYVTDDVSGYLVSSSVEATVSSYVTEASTLIECGSSVAGANSTYIDCPPAYNSSSQQQGVQMAPTDPNNATSTLEAHAQGQMMEYSGSNVVFTDDLGYLVHPQAYRFDSSPQLQELQMPSAESNGVSASMDVSFESQGQGSTYVTGDDSGSNQYEFMKEIQWEVDDSFWA